MHKILVQFKKSEGTTELLSELPTNPVICNCSDRSHGYYMFIGDNIHLPWIPDTWRNWLREGYDFDVIMEK